MTPTRVFTVGRDSAFRDGLRAALVDRACIEFAGAADLGEEAVRSIETCSPDVVLVDLQIPSLSGAEFLSSVISRSPALSGMVLSDYVSDEHVLACLEAGAKACVAKDIDPDRLAEYVELVAAGARPIDDAVAASPDVAARVARFFRDAPATGRTVVKALTALTAQEQNVLNRLAEGVSPSDVLANLDMTPERLAGVLRSVAGKLLVNRATLRVAESCRY